MGNNGDQHPQQTTQKVLPQFHDTKLGRLRFGAPTSGVIDENFFRNYWITILYLVINIALLVTGIVILIKLDLYYVGWITIGVWILLTVFGVTASISFCYKRMNTFRRNDVEMNNQVSSSDATKPPVIDPIMMRAVVNLVYHGQEDCPECKLLRHRDEYARTKGPTSMPANSETESQQNPSSFRYSDGTKKRKGYVNGAYNQSDRAPEIEQHSIPMDMRDKREHQVTALVEKYSDRMTSSDEEEGLCDETIPRRNYNSNSNSNNNNNVSVTDASPDIRGSRFGYCDAGARHLHRNSSQDTTGRQDKRQTRSVQQDMPTKRNSENKHTRDRDVTMKKHRKPRKNEEKTHTKRHKNDTFLNYCITNNLVPKSNENRSYETFVEGKLSTTPPRGYENSIKDKLTAVTGDITKAYGQLNTSKNNIKTGEIAEE